MERRCVSTKKKGTPWRPLFRKQRAYLFFAAFFFPPLAFFAMRIPPFTGGLRGPCFCSGALCRLARWPGVRRPRFVGYPAITVAREQQLGFVGIVRIKKWGAQRAPRRSKRKI